MYLSMTKFMRVQLDTSIISDDCLCIVRTKNCVSLAWFYILRIQALCILVVYCKCSSTTNYPLLSDHRVQT